jgi:nitroreductase
LPAGTIIIGCVGIADGGMIGTAVALEVPGENSCEVCAETAPPLAQSNAEHSTKQAPSNRQTGDVSRIPDLMENAVLDRNQGKFKPAPAGLSLHRSHARRFSPRILDQKMPDAIELLKTRRSVKPMELKAPGPSAAQLDTLLTIASRVPDHGKLSPWRFIVFEGPARLKPGEKIAEIFQKRNPDATAEQIEFERARLARAPLVIAVVSRAAPNAKIPEWEQLLSSGAAAMNLVIAANALGFAASWLTEWYAYDREVLEALGLAPNEKIAGFVHIGTAATLPGDRDRPALSAVVRHFEG